MRFAKPSELAVDVGSDVKVVAKDALKEDAAGDVIMDVGLFADCECKDDELCGERREDADFELDLSTPRKMDSPVLKFEVESPPAKLVPTPLTGVLC